ncbi:hypothetical protein ACHAW5_003820 [Stephanodiscus triporus]|uniref:Uncharacterized protein n=1 Tax=Stephanodiscus triporus TaxID=2934178 RepID=A0ABD3RDB6_9STRA
MISSILLQPFAAIATASAGATALILSVASISNICETRAIVQQHRQGRRLDSWPQSSPPAPPKKSWKSTDEAVAGLSGMNRKELVELFLRCDPPSDARELAFEDDGDEREEGGGGCWVYDGYLLDNGPILTRVTNFITNRLFGRGEKWLGKSYLKPTTSSFDRGGVGRNRFSLSRRAAATVASNDKVNESLDRTFDYYIGTSVLPSASTSKSLFHCYAPHCAEWSPMSLIWRGMVDELRAVNLEGSDGGNARNREKVIFLGMGYFSWSGGVFNMAPFCLVPRPRLCASERLKEE